MSKTSPLQKALNRLSLQLPRAFDHFEKARFNEDKPSKDTEDASHHFPEIHNQPYLKLGHGKENSKSAKVGVVFSGGQAPGGHNVLCGLYDALKKRSSSSELIGFLGGPGGFLKDNHIELNHEILSDYRNIGGFDLLGSGRTKIEKDEDLEKAREVADQHKLDAFVIIGGDDSNTNAALLAEYFKKCGQNTAVIGVPKTIDGDLMNDYVEVSFGFDTACKVYSEMIGNICVDARSAKKYTHFVKLMGRAASHITLECALKTQPNYAFIAEEVLAEKKSLKDLTQELVDLILERSEKEKNYGVILIPEGLIDFIPELSQLNHEINKKLAHEKSLTPKDLEESLSGSLEETFKELPKEIQKQLLLTRDPHGNIQLSKIDTQKLLIDLVEKQLEEQNFKGHFNPVSHFMGYEGRCAHPSLFDAEYTYALGWTAALLALEGRTGYMAAIKNLKSPTKDWEIYGLPITNLIHLEHRHGKDKPVIKKALVDLNGPSFKAFKRQREDWRLKEHYLSPGPIQYFGDEIVTQIKNSIIDLKSKP